MSAIQEFACRSCHETSTNLLAGGLCPACLFLPLKSEQPASETPGELIADKYLLGELLGAGGMGQVFRASQEEPVRREVAVKILKRGMDSEEILNRFEAERQILALLDHPNISRIMDGGILDDGRSFFVMELAGDQPIKVWLRKNPISIRKKIILFRKIVSAIAHAHQRGIIHRDLKPSNILMKGEEPLVIDFGIAKVLDQKMTEETLMTRAGHVIGTPVYMSPEQAQGSVAIDTRTDIYGLGSVLYEILTGEQPFEMERFKTASPTEIEKILTMEIPLRPSKRSDHDKLRREIDWIVMKCLEKDPGLRYQTAESLIEDLDAFLNNETVAARPPSVGYRTGKFVSRHRVLLGTTALVLGALSAGLVASQIEARKAREARDEMATVKNASETLIADVVSTLYPEAQKTGNNSALIKSAGGIKTYLDQLPESGGDDYGILHRHAEAYHLAGKMLASAGNFTEASSCFKSETTLRERILPLAPNPPRARYKLGISLNASGWCVLKQGDASSARELFTESIEYHKKQIGIEDPHFTWISALQRVARNLSLAEQNLEDWEAAHEAALLSMEASDRFARMFPDEPSISPVRADATEVLSAVLAHIDKNKSLELAQEALELSLKDTNNPHHETGIAESRGILADALAAVGNISEALDETEKVIVIWRRYSSENPEIGNYRTLLADQLSKKAELAERAGDLAQSSTAALQAIREYEDLLKRNPQDQHARQMISDLKEKAESVAPPF